MNVDMRVGARFEHASQLEPNWTPGPGQRYADGPKRIMEITRRIGTTVYYRPVGSAGAGWVCDEAEMTERGTIVGRWLDTPA